MATSDVRDTRPTVRNPATGGAIEVASEFYVHRPPHEVYEFLVDTAHFRMVDRALVDFEPQGRMVVGMRGTMRHRRAGLSARTRWRVVDLVPDERLFVEIRGPGYAMSEEVLLAERDAGTAMQVVDHLAGTSRLGRIFVRISNGPIRRDLAARGARLMAALGPT